MLVSTISFLGALMILVFVHEWGHFIVAKLSGVRVDIFSIGFGPKLIGFKWHGTEYRIAPIPFGGFVKIYGQEPLEEANGDVEEAKRIAEHPDSFASKSIFKRLAVVFAGPFMNVVLCFAVLPLVFIAGKMESKDIQATPVIVDVTKGSPAELAGLKAGDTILEVEGTSVDSWRQLVTQVAIFPNETVTVTYSRDGVEAKVEATLGENERLKQPVGYLGVEDFLGNEPIIGRVAKGKAAFEAGLKKNDWVTQVGDTPIKYWTQMTALIQASKGESLPITVKRGEELVTVNLSPKYEESIDRYLIGIEKGIDRSKLVHKSYGFVKSVELGAKEGVRLVGLTFDILKRLFTGNLSLKVLGGPLQIAQATSTAYKSGFGEFLFILAFLSLQLGILNLLPIPVLDGGHVVFMTIESLIRRPIPHKLRNVSMQLGLFMLLGMMVLVTINDVNTMWGDSGLIKSIKSFF